ncbi:MAG: dTMP kinase [Actinomycetota bacterium]|nr:dTMP kinase [Actinomycetota bacterium]
MTCRGVLIAFEGGEGAGKSTQARLLADAIDAELTREPGGTDLGDRIREWLLHPDAHDEGRSLDPRTELMLMLAARAQHVSERIGPVLESGRDVVVDRFSASTLAYQGYGRGLPIEEVRRACSLASGDLWPDLNILLDVAPAIGAGRAAPCSLPDRIEAEGEGFHERVALGFRALAAADSDRWVVIDASLDVGAVARAVREAVSTLRRRGGPR